MKVKIYEEITKYNLLLYVILLWMNNNYII